MRVTLLACALLLVFCVVAFGDHEFYNGGPFVVSVTGNGNVPKYTFWAKGDSGAAYKVMFQQLFEASYEKGQWSKEPASTLALPSLDWTFGPVVNSTNVVSFNITGVPKHNSTNPKQNRFDYIIFRNHFHTYWNCTFYNESKANICVEFGFLKFDVVISNYRWVSQGTPSLVLFFKFTPVNNDNATPDIAGNLYYFGGVYLKIGNTAHTLLNPNVSVSVQSLFLSNGVWVIYGHFNGSLGLEHDPQIGIDGPVPYTPGGDGGSGSFPGWAIAIIVLGSVGALLVVAIVVGLLLYVRYRRYGYRHLASVQ